MIFVLKGILGTRTHNLISHRMKLRPENCDSPPPKITKLVISNSFSFKPPYLHCHPTHNFVAWLWRHHRKQYQVASESSPLPCLPQVHVYTGVRCMRCEILGEREKGQAEGQDSWTPGLCHLLSHWVFWFVVLFLSFQTIMLTNKAPSWPYPAYPDEQIHCRH